MRALCLTQLVFWGVCAHGAAQGLPEPFLSDLLANLSARSARLNPSSLKYRIGYHETSDGLKERTKKDLAETNQVLEIEHARNGDRFRILMENKVAGPMFIPSSFVVFNGKICISTTSRDKEFHFSQSPFDAECAESPLGIVGEDTLRQLLKWWHAGEAKLSKFSQAATQSRDGTSLITVSFVVLPSSWKYTFHLAPDREYAVYSTRVHDDHDRLLQDAKGDHFSDVEGIWFPHAGESRDFTHDGRVASTKSFKIISLTTRAAEVPETLFTASLPKDAILFDKDAKTFIRNTAFSQEEWQRVVNLARPPRPLWQVWIQWLLLVGVSLVAIIMLRRKFWGRSDRQPRK